jgi:hypothetical protein
MIHLLDLPKAVPARKAFRLRQESALRCRLAAKDTKPLDRIAAIRYISPNIANDITKHRARQSPGPV